MFPQTVPAGTGRTQNLHVLGCSDRRRLLSGRVPCIPYDVYMPPWFLLEYIRQFNFCTYANLLPQAPNWVL